MKIEKIIAIVIMLLIPLVCLRSQVTIGSNTPPHSSAVLELSSSNKGFLGPKVDLESQTDQTTITSPATGLIAFNLGNNGLNYEGYVFWDGDEWRAFNNNSLSEGSIGAITCNNVTLTPSTYTIGEEYTGTLTVPYTGANGGVYPAQTIGPINGLTATLASGNFNTGSGTLSYTVKGVPSETSPHITIFPINIGGQICEANVGAGDVMNPGELVYYRTNLDAKLSSVWLSTYANDLPIIGGKLRLDAYFNIASNVGNGNVTMYPRLVNTSDTPVRFWFSALTTIDSFNAGNYLIAPGGYVELDNGIYYGYGYNDIYDPNSSNSIYRNGRSTGSGQAGNQEVVTVDISLDDKWYRIYYFPIVDNMNTTSNSDDQRILYLSIQRLY